MVNKLKSERVIAHPRAVFFDSFNTVMVFEVLGLGIYSSCLTCINIEIIFVSNERVIFKQDDIKVVLLAFEFRLIGKPKLFRF